MNTEAIEAAKAWAQNTYFSEGERSEIQSLLDNKDHKEIEERFYKDLEFGTGGMRSIIGFGPNRINKYTIRRATYALALQLKETFQDNISVAISYDSRRYSFEFAKEVAQVLYGNNIKSYIYKRLNPVPLLSYSVRYHKAQAGVMITASHNPPEYNGYKVYWNDGAQVTPPEDKLVIEKYNRINDFSEIPLKDFEQGLKEQMIFWVDEDVEQEYFNSILKYVINPKLCQEKGKELKIVYTAIHGTGGVPCTMLLDKMGLSSYEVVKEQQAPDEDFPTVKSPNPENPEAMAMAVDLMKKNKADITFGTDPDTDRLGVAVLRKNGDVVYPNGNQIGVLMLHYILTQKKQLGTLTDNGYFIKTIVTSNLQEKLAQSFGLKTYNTLTGFKWICGKMNEIEANSPEAEFVFATEESFGYLPHPHVRDKDGVASLGLMAEVALYYKLQGMDLIDALDLIYEQYGFSNETLLSLDYFGIEGAQKINRIMETFRNYEGSDFVEEIESLEDYQSLTIKDWKTKTLSPIDFTNSNVLGFRFKSGNKLYLRPSGTEPKIKFYIMISENEGDLDQKKKMAQQKTDQFLAMIKELANKA
ncbi:MAG: phospho-sugar mutase [Bacteriovoracaceae bacterium]